MHTPWIAHPRCALKLLSGNTIWQRCCKSSSLERHKTVSCGCKFDVDDPVGCINDRFVQFLHAYMEWFGILDALKTAQTALQAGSCMDLAPK